MTAPKTFIVTGAGGGIGSAVCARLVADGHLVVAADRDEAALLALSERFPQVVPAVVDLSDPAECRQLVETAIRNHGQVDGAVLGAAIMSDYEPSSQTPELFDLMMRVNVLAGFIIATEVASAISSRKGSGSIVMFSSGAASWAIGIPFYSASKGAIESITRELSRSWAPQGTRVNAVVPSTTDTPMMAKTKEDPARLEKLLSGVGLGRLADPSEVANVVAFLLSGEASYVSGQVIRIDGGRVSAI